VASRVIGVDLGTTQIRAAEVELSGKPGAPVAGTVVAFGAIPVPSGAIADGEVIEVQTVSSLLKQLWGRAKFSHKNVVIGVGNPRTVVREMEVPALPMDQLRSSLPFQVAEILPMPTDEALLDFYPTGYRNDDGRELLRGILVAVGKATASNGILAIETAGLRPVGVDLSAFALHRAQMTLDWSQQVVAFVDIGARVTTVVVAAQGQPRLVRLLPSGGQDATDAIASAMQIPLAEAEQFKRAVGIGADVPPQQQLARDAVTQSTRQLVEGIRNTFVYFSGNNPGQPIQHVVLTGGGAVMPGLGQYLASASRLPVSFGSGVARVKINKKAAPALTGQEYLASMAIGLALTEVEQ
jgi:type IV pilus assembly protein PilM